MMKSLDDMTEVELRELFLALCKEITRRLPNDTGFMLFASPLGPRCCVAQYAGNVDRECATEWMLETIERWKNDDFIENG